MYYTIENDYLTVQINDAGAELHSIVNKENGVEYLWQGNPDIWYGQSPVLFPFIGRLLDDKYRYNGKEYTMQKHGFARKRTFESVSCTGSEAVFVLRSDDTTRPSYPFEFELYVKFTLKGKTLQATHTVVNKTDGEMYFSLGGHPGFNCAIGDYLEFDQPETLDTETIDADSIRIAEKTPVLRGEKRITITEDIFNNDALILSGIRSKAVTLRSDKHDRAVRFTFGDVPFLGIWAKPGAPYVCIEPWCGVNDDRNVRTDVSEKEGIVRLPKGGVFDLVYTAEII
ncbi:MAG: aldose 1-epimerase family protein [Oscillospiraceae bacterium]|nr:aldose 1-epimerase family protein [Oscillospiraceae bacterium]